MTLDIGLAVGNASYAKWEVLGALMSKVADSYVVLFEDDVGNVHAVTFPKSKEQANSRANALLKVLHEIGCDVQKYGKYSRGPS